MLYICKMSIRSYLTEQVADRFRKPAEVVFVNPADSSEQRLKLEKTDSQRAIEKLSDLSSECSDTELLAELKKIQDTALALKIFKSDRLGVDNKEALDLFFDLSQSAHDEIRNTALSIIFDHAEQRSSSLITNSIDTDKKASLLSSLASYLINEDNPEERLFHAENIAATTEAYITDPNQKIHSEASFSRENNFIGKLRAQNGFGAMLYKIINQSSLYDDNQGLANEAIASGTGSKTIKANLRAKVEINSRSRFNLLPSANFGFKINEGDPTEKPYDMNSFLDDVCNNGPEEALDNFINKYTQMTRVKEELKLTKKPDRKRIESITKQQQKALKFIFESEKLSQLSEEGNAVFESIQDAVKQRGHLYFLNALFQNVKGPNEKAALRTVLKAYKKHYGEPLTFTDKSGNSQQVSELREFDRAIKKIEKDYKELTETRAKTILSNNGINEATKASYIGQKDLVERKAKVYSDAIKKIKSKPNPEESKRPEDIDKVKLKAQKKEKIKLIKEKTIAFRDELAAKLPDVDFSHIEDENSFTISSLKEYALSSLAQDFSLAGEDFEVHIKSGGAVQALAGLNQDEESLSAEKKLVRDILEQDEIRAEKLFKGEKSIGIVEELLTQEKDGINNLYSSITGIEMLLEKVQAIPASTSDEQKTKDAAIDYIYESFLGVSPGTLNISSGEESIAQEIETLGYKSIALRSNKEFITRKARDEYANEVAMFLKYTIGSEADIDDIKANVETLSDNLEKMNSDDVSDSERYTLELENLKLIGIDSEDLNSIAFDQGMFTGSLLDANNDNDFVQTFLNTIKAVLEYLKNAGKE